MEKNRLYRYSYNALIVLCLLGGAVYVVSQFIHFGRGEFTDNARVRQNIVPQNCRVQGFIREVRFTDFQQVQKGDTLFSIAKRHGMSVEELRAYNTGLTASLNIGQKISIPGSAQTKASAQKTIVHIVKKGDTLYSIGRNYNVSVKEINNKVIFLRKLVRGGSEHSFGIHVAKMAGMPLSIIKRAEQILKQLENGSQKGNINKPLVNVGEQREGMQLSFFQLDDPVLEQIRDEIKNLDVNNLTPIEALNKLNDIKRIITGK